MQMKLSDVRVGTLDGCQCGGMCGRCSPQMYRQAVQALAQKNASGTAVGNLRATEVKHAPGLAGLGDLVMVVQ